MEEQQNKNSKPNEDERKVSDRRREPANAPRPRRRNQLSTRCVLIRNLPKGFMNWSDVAVEDQSIRVNRMVYCEDSRGSIMVEFSSVVDRNKILALDRQRRTRNLGQEPQDAPDNALEIKVQVERCTSQAFVNRVLSDAPFSGNNPASSPLLTGLVTNSTKQPTSNSSSSPSVNRCIVIRKISNGDEEEEGEHEIAEAPEHDTKIMRLDDISVQTGSSNNIEQQPHPSPTQQQRQPRPMEIRSGDLSEMVVRAAVLRNSGKVKLMPAMLIELGSKESVDRIFRTDGTSKGTNGGAVTTTLAVPVVVLAVKSERYARFCFTDVKPIRRSNGQESRSSTIEGANVDSDNGGATSEENTTTLKTKGQVTKESANEEKVVSRSVKKADNGEQEDNRKEDGLENKKIKDLEKEIRSMRSELGRWKARATKPNVSDKGVENGNGDEGGLETKTLDQINKDLQKEIRDLNSNVGRFKTRAERFEKELLQSRGDANGKNGSEEGVSTAPSDEKSSPIAEDPTHSVEERFKELEKKHSDLTALHRSVEAESEKTATDLRVALEERDTAVAELQGFKSAWKTRMDTLRQLEDIKNGGAVQGCTDCEIVEFYASLESLGSSPTDDSNDGECECGKEDPAVAPENGSEADAKPTTPVEEVS
mmetsp:Transcript_22256/g.52891  ORF Transcript_22256/g.52891 Transcript_22256/m.52891 type:complete len:649 (-) Transcript_22256:29-1975(-)|eukprot:CAMPEP_0197187048 /NCGR_PEP_ID=MMETSP1423-20130617/15124_1 /TAXON_ID=476441 /ORGANISM="Pseudo-nitzschia heimii, Strain UNC1101" /LENGTH=648 /DNA_ID=CAMNT_0042638525 /DNA_START=103 /DNA_END=2049 /DNA_ORIENTATION=-